MTFRDSRPRLVGRIRLVLAGLVAGGVGCAGHRETGAGAAPLSRTYEQSYLPASHNWAFRRHYVRADRLFNAFDYGHAVLAEILYTHPRAPNETLDRTQFRFISQHVLVHPPSVPLEERAIAPQFPRLAPELGLMFDWAHMLHRQLYDVWADDRIPDNAKDARIADLVAYYESRRDLALSARPKTMAPMEARDYSGHFRRRYPRFNGLIWSYHWLQLALYEALMSDSSASGREAAVGRAIDRFDAMIACPAERLPGTMPMAAAVAPRFVQRYPEAAAIFDNLHALHDVVSDILVSPTVPPGRKRAALLAAATEYRDDEREVLSVDEWRDTALSMGVGDIGGPGTVPASRPSSGERTACKSG